MFRICFVWVYIIKGKVIPYVKLASISRLCKCMFLHTCRIVSYVYPKSFYVKGKTAYLGFYCCTIFYDNKPSFHFYVVKGLEGLTNFSSRHTNV